MAHPDDCRQRGGRDEHARRARHHHRRARLRLPADAWRGLRLFEEYQAREEWARGQINDRLVGLKGLTIGIAGFGNIGRAIARRAAGFEMRALAVDAQPVAPGEGVAEVWPLGRLNDLCREADVLAIAAPITPETRGMIGAEQLGCWRLLSAGDVARRDRRRAGADRGAQVGPPGRRWPGRDGGRAIAPPGDPLWKAPSIIITPHNSPASRLTTELVWSILSENIGASRAASR